MSVNKIRIRSLSEEGDKRARRVDRLISENHRWLGALLILNNVANIATSAITTAIATNAFGSAGVGIATGVVTLVVLIFAEMTPKSVAMRRADGSAMAVSGLVLFFAVLLKPLIFLLNAVTSGLARLVSGRDAASPLTITEEELLTMVDVSHEEGVLEVEEKDMIRNVFEFGDDQVGAIMVPRIRVATVDDDDDAAGVLEVMRTQRFSRLPVMNSETGEVMGVLHIKDLVLKSTVAEHLGEFRAIDVMRPAHFVYEFNNAAKTFHQMRKAHISMSVVLDEYGVMVGVVTMEDFIEEIVGDIDDEYDDPEQDIEQLSSHEYLLDGSVSIDEVNEKLGLSIETDDFESIGGYIMGELGGMPEPGAVMACSDVAFEIQSIKSNRIEKLKATLAPPEEGLAAAE